MVKYCLVGFGSLGIHAACYHVLSRTIWVDGPKTLEYVIASVSAGIFNFTFHRLWTFSRNDFSARMVMRYVLAVVAGIAVQAGIFSIGVDWLHVFDYFAFASSVVLTTALMYLVHRFFTFSDRFERKAKAQVHVEGVRSNETGV